jgi:hypothetical protein
LLGQWGGKPRSVFHRGYPGYSLLVKMMLPVGSKSMVLMPAAPVRKLYLYE